MPPKISSTNGTPGLLSIGTIKKVIPNEYAVEVSLNPSLVADQQTVKAQLPVSYYSSDGVFAGGAPEVGTTVIILQAEGGAYYVLSTMVRNYTSVYSVKNAKLQDLDSGNYYITAGENNVVKVSLTDGIFIGSKEDYYNFDANRGLASNTFDTSLKFTESSREISGVVKRDIKPNLNMASSLRLTSHEYDDTLKVISMDPKTYLSQSNFGNSVKNPPFVENRKLTYEFAYSYDVSNELNEIELYKKNKSNNVDTNILSRRKSRADTLSLSLVEPNYLIESISGTVVDIYGNLIDINRNIIPVGQSEELSAKTIKTSINSSNSSYKKIRELQRKSLALHWELNARKSTEGPPNVNATDNYSRNRSRMFIDIDKEGMFKINIPATSETGNVPLLTRYENFTTVYPNPKSNNPDDLVFNSDNVDILLEPISSVSSVVKLTDSSSSSNEAPLNRLSSSYLGWGTAYHNVTSTLRASQASTLDVDEYIPTTSFTLGRIVSIKDVIASSIKAVGASANAGGRSGSINLDGSLDLNIGANTVNRQSLVLDTQGGLIGNIGRDKNNISAGLSLDGDFYIEIGGTTPNEDTRFKDLDNLTHRAGAFDLKVFNINKNVVSVFRIDNEGITVSTPGKITMYANEGMTFRSVGDINIESDQLYLNRRLVRKKGGAI